MPVWLRTWLRYLVPLTVLGAVACVPLVAIAFRVKLPADAAAARTAVHLGWILAAAGILSVLLVVSAVSPALRGISAGPPLSQWAALVAGARNLVHGLAPWLVSLLAIVLGGAALVIPGALLAVLVSLTGASTELARGPRPAIADSMARVRRQLPRVAVIVAGIVAVQLAVAGVLQIALIPALTKKTPAAALVPVVVFVRSVALATTAFAPMAACALAAAYSDAKRR